MANTSYPWLELLLEKFILITVDKYYQLFSWNDRLTLFISKKINAHKIPKSESSQCVLWSNDCSVSEGWLTPSTVAQALSPETAVLQNAGPFCVCSHRQWWEENGVQFGPLPALVLRGQHICSQCFYPINTNNDKMKKVNTILILLQK